MMTMLTLILWIQPVSRVRNRFPSRTRVVTKVCKCLFQSYCKNPFIIPIFRVVSDQSLEMFVSNILYSTEALINIPSNIPSNICFHTGSGLSKSLNETRKGDICWHPQFLIVITIIKITIVIIIVIIIIIIINTSFLSARFGTLRKLLNPRSRKEVLIPTWLENIVKSYHQMLSSYFVIK